MSKQLQPNSKMWNMTNLAETPKTSISQYMLYKTAQLLSNLSGFQGLSVKAHFQPQLTHAARSDYLLSAALAAV